MLSLWYSNRIFFFRRAYPGAVRGGRREADEPDGDGAVQAAAVPHQQARQDGAEGGAHARQGSGTAAMLALSNMAELVKFENLHLSDPYQNKHILHARVLWTQDFKDVVNAMRIHVGMSGALSQYATEKGPDSEKPWAVYNSYYDEKTADAQWRERERRDRIRQFRE